MNPTAVSINSFEETISVNALGTLISPCHLDNSLLVLIGFDRYLSEETQQGAKWGMKMKMMI